MPCQSGTELSHYWNFGDGDTSTLSNPNHLYLTTDTFKVTHYITDACGNSDTAQLNVIINDEVNECCPDTTISTSTVWDLTTNLPGNGRFHTIKVTQGVSLTIEDGLVLEFCEDGALVIENGAYVDLDGTLTSFGDMTWQGVFVQGDTSLGQHNNLLGGGFGGLQQGMIYTRDGSMIKNAKIGIRNFGEAGHSSSGGMIRCEGTSFINNTISVEFGPYQNYKVNDDAVPSLGSFRDCAFKTDSAYYISEPFFGFIKLRKADGMRFAGCEFTNGLLPELPSQVSNFGFGIHSVSSGFEVYPIGSTVTTPLCESPCVVNDSTTFNGLGHGIYVMTQDKMRPYSIYQTQFENCFRGITSVGSTGGTMLFNTFKMGAVPDTDFSYGQIGVELHFDHEGFELQENIFERVDGGLNLNTIGILANALGGNDNFIRRNTFIGIETANQAFGINADLTPDIQRGLVYFCNTSDSTLSQGYDFHIPNTPAFDIIHPFQTPGAFSGQEISAGNHFAYSAHDFMNYDIDSIRYFFNILGQNEEPRDSLISGLKKFQANENLCAQEYCSPPCLEEIDDAKEDYTESIADFFESYEDYLEGLSTQNDQKIKSSRSKALFYRKDASRAAYQVILHTLIDSINYHPDSLVTWFGIMDTYGAEVLAAGEYASLDDYASSLTILETISNRRTLSSEQLSDLESIIYIYNLMDTKNIESLNSSDRASLRSIAYSNIGISSGLARSILSFFNEYIPLPYYDSHQIEFRTENSTQLINQVINTDNQLLTLYPNPSSNQVYAKWNQEIFQPQSIKMYDLLGRPVVEFAAINNGSAIAELFTFANGIHIVVAKDGNGKTVSQRIVMLK